MDKVWLGRRALGASQYLHTTKKCVLGTHDSDEKFGSPSYEDMKGDQWHLIGKFTGSFELARRLAYETRLQIAGFKGLEPSIYFSLRSLLCMYKARRSATREPRRPRLKTSMNEMQRASLFIGN